VFQVVSSLQVFQPKICTHLSSTPMLLHASTHLILLDHTRTRAQYSILLKRKNSFLFGINTNTFITCIYKIRNESLLNSFHHNAEILYNTYSNIPVHRLWQNFIVKQQSSMKL
jgi:hypothetical protein